MPAWLVLSAGLVGAVILVPLASVVLQAATAERGAVRRAMSGPLLPTLLVHTVALTAIVSSACAVIGFGVAWLTERTDVAGRRVLAVVLVLPLAVPEYVAGYAWVALAPGLQGLAGAALVMTLALYPLVLLPVAAALARSDPALDEVARSLGVGPWRRFTGITLPAVRGALVGGTLLVALYLLAEYGAFAVLRYRTFATVIYTQYTQFYDPQVASVLTLVLCVIGVTFLAAERVGGARGHPGRESARPAYRTRLAPAARVGAAAGLGALGALALGVPVGSVVRQMIRGSSTTLPSADVVGITVRTLVLGAVAAVTATALAVPVAVLEARHRGALAAGVVRVAFLDRALPGIAVGLALATLAVHHVHRLYQTTALLEIAYVTLFFPLALVAVRAAVARVPPELDDVSRSLGAGPAQTLRRVTLPLVVPGLLAAATLVWLSATTELTATLLLRPTGVATLATQFWAYTSGLAYGAAAPYAAIMITVSVVPVLLLTRMARRF